MYEPVADRALLECVGLGKTFGRGRSAQRALDEVSLSFSNAESCVLLGPSGSGKTTLLAILGCLLSPSTGELLVRGKTVDFAKKKRLVEMRRSTFGFVFQKSQLLPFLTVEENLFVVGQNCGLPADALQERVDYLLERLDILDIRAKFPEEASSGEQQRVAIARALLARPPIVLADEPTAALDRENGERVIRLLVEHARQDKALLIAVTHDTRIVDRFDQVLGMDSGKVIDR